jgi:3-hydroxy-9,10-secoandrosta-1,3,5(10)-triene-9,17-dione monooxygenase reductase component
MSGTTDERAWRQALGGFATGVVLIATDTTDAVAGIIVNSFTSVSLSPRLVLWCLGDESDRYGHFAGAERWSVNILAADQEGVARQVAAPGGWRTGDLVTGRLEGAPVLPGAVTQIACRTVERRTLGDHLVIVGEAGAFAVSPAPVLTYFRGRFGRAEG